MTDHDEHISTNKFSSTRTTKMTVAPRASKYSNRASRRGRQRTSGAVSFLTIAVILGLLVDVVDALSTGAAACPGGEAAVGGAHLSAVEITNTPLNESTIGARMLLDGIPMSTDAPTNFQINREHTLSLQSNLGAPFRGFLLRLGSNENNTDTTEALHVEDDNSVVKIADTVCVLNENVGGLTHTNNLDKTGIAAKLKLDQVAYNLPLDVTVVVVNNGQTSTYHYSRYMLNAVESVSVVESDSSDDSSSSGSRMIDSRLLTLPVVTLLMVWLFGTRQ